MRNIPILSKGDVREIVREEMRSELTFFKKRMRKIGEQMHNIVEQQRLLREGT